MKTINRQIALIVALMGLALGGCSTMQLTQTETKQPQRQTVPISALGNVEYHTSELADELFATVNTRDQYRYAVVGFAPVSTLAFNAKEQHPLMLLGKQLEQGLMTEASRRGLTTQDFRVTNDIILSKDAESVQSRDVALLSTIRNVDFYITGTITEQQEGAIVNARIVHVKSKDVVAAATKFFPGELFWQREMVTTRGGMLYRVGQ